MRYGHGNDVDVSVGGCGVNRFEDGIDVYWMVWG